MQIFYSSKFAREYKKLPEKIKDLAEQRELVFRKNPFDTILGAHKLHGKLKDFWSFAIGYNYRIIFEFKKDKGTVYFHSVGDHEIYQ